MDSSQNFAPVISGLNASDAIDPQGMTATSASYNNGLLTLLNGVTPVAYLHLSGNYAGAAFYALGNGQSTTQVGILTGGDTSTAPAGTSGADNYVWAGAVEGSWDVAGNWNDTTAGLSPASVAPGGNDNVTIGSLGNALSDVITGTGNSASLTIAGAAILDGQFTTGKLVMGTSTTVFGGIVLDSGASLLVTGDVTGGNNGAPISSSYQINGGTFTVDGNFAPNSANISASDGGHVQLAWLASSYGNFDVLDATSSLEIGTAGGTAAGTFTVDSGVTTALTGNVQAPSIVDNGTIVVAGTLVLSGGVVTGPGSFEIDSGGLLEFGAFVSAGTSVSFQGTGATLKLDNVALPGSFSGAVTGFSTGDTIDLVGVNTGNVSVSNAGSLHIDYGTGSIALGGNYNPADFTIGTDGHGGTDVTWTYQAPVISTSGLTITQNGNGTTTIAGLQVSDSDAAASGETFTIAATTDAASSGTGVSPSTGSGLLTAINTELATGITYNPGVTPPSTDKVSLSVTDGFGATDTVNFVFNLASNPSTPVTLVGTSGKDVIFATGNSDTLTGSGGADQFVFRQTTGTHTITDFSTIEDHIDLTALSSIVTAATLNSWIASNVKASATNPADTLVTLGSSETITLHNVLATNVHANDFIVHA